MPAHVACSPCRHLRSEVLSVDSVIWMCRITSMFACMQISSALAPENQPDYTQLNNATYLMQSFEKLISDLESPFGVRPCPFFILLLGLPLKTLLYIQVLLQGIALQMPSSHASHRRHSSSSCTCHATELCTCFCLVYGFSRPLGLSDACMLQVVGGGSVFSYAPCFANLAPAAVSAFATGVSVAPALAVITPEGVNIQPQGLNIQPVSSCLIPVFHMSTLPCLYGVSLPSPVKSIWRD